MTPDSQLHKAGKTGVLWLVPALAAALLVSLYASYGIDRSLWLDEANTALIANGSPGQIIDALTHDVSPPLYYFLLSGWMRVFGNSEIALRLPSILFFLAGVGVMWLVGRRLLGPEGAGLAAFIYAVNPIVGRQAQNARMYTMVALMVALSLLVFVNIVLEPKRRTPGWFALFGLIAFLGLNTHYWFAFVLLAYACWVLVTWQSWSVRDLVLLGTFSAGPFLLVNLAMFLHQTTVPATLWTRRPGLSTLVQSGAGEFGLLPLHSFQALGGAMVLSVPIVWSLLKRRCNWQAVKLRIVLLPAVLYGVSLLVPFLISIKRPVFWVGRYDVIAVPLFAALAASVLLFLPSRPRLLFQLFMAALCAAYFVRTVEASGRANFWEALDPVPLGDRAAARAICSDSAPGDFVVYTGLSRAAISLYLQHFGCGNNLKQISYPAEFEKHMAWQDPRRNYSQEPAIKREADRVAAAAYASGARIFLLFNDDARLSAGIVSSIEERFRRQSSRRFVSCEWCFSEVRVYAPKSAGP